MILLRWDTQSRVGCHPGLEPDAASYFQTIIGVIVDQVTKHNNEDVIVCYYMQHYPGEGHFRCSSACHGLCQSEVIIPDFSMTSYPEIDHSGFKKCDWSEFDWDAEEVYKHENAF